MSEISKYQKFEAVTVHRSQLKNAPYNPRIIDEKERKQLKKLLKKNGLVETLVWNKRTGNLVGGHQRISILDELEGTSDYMLTVAMIDVDARREKELNISLNNTSAQGRYDFDVLKGFDIDWDNTGFDASDISYFKADEVLSETSTELNAAEREALASVGGMTAEEEAEAAAEAERKKAHVKNVKAQQAANVAETGEKFVILTFRSVIEKREWLMKFGFPEVEKYLDAYTLEAIIKKK